MEILTILSDKDRSFLYFNERSAEEEGRYVETLSTGETVQLPSYVLKNGLTVHEQPVKSCVVDGVAYINTRLVDDDGSSVVP